MAKKNLTPTQQVKKYKRISRATFGAEFLSIIAPFLAVGIANWNKYFYEYNGTKISVAAVLAFGIMGMAIWMVAKKKLENAYVALLIGWGVFVAIAWLTKEIANDIFMISFCGWFGLAGAFGLDLGSKKALKKANEIQEGIELGKKEMTKNAYIEEVTESKSKKGSKVEF